MRIVPTSVSQHTREMEIRPRLGSGLRFGELYDDVPDDPWGGGAEDPDDFAWDEGPKQPWEQEFANLPWRAHESEGDLFGLVTTPFLEREFDDWHYDAVEGLAKVKGQIDAQLEVAWRNKTGIRAPWGQPNLEKAEKWFREAAMQGDPLGQYYLGRLLLEDKPNPKSWRHRFRELWTRARQATPQEIEAYTWFELASHQRDTGFQEVLEASCERKKMEQWMSPNALLKARHKAQETAGAIAFLKSVDD